MKIVSIGHARGGDSQSSNSRINSILKGMNEWSFHLKRKWLIDGKLTKKINMRKVFVSRDVCVKTFGYK